MSKQALLHALRSELERWSRKRYDQLRDETFPLHFQRQLDGRTYYFEAEVLEDRPDYMHVAICVDDGGWRAFKPLSTSFIVYANGNTSIPSI